MTASFTELGLSQELLKAVEDLGFEEPSPIQVLAIPALLTGKDAVGQAQTGTGKTAAALSEIIGKYDHTKVEASQGNARGFFRILPHDRHEDIRFSTENRYRVMDSTQVRQSYLTPVLTRLFISTKGVLSYGV